MAYVLGNPKTKKELKERVANGEKVGLFTLGPFEPKMDGTEYVEGPQYPEPHRWYAKVEVKDGFITKVT